MFCPNANCMIKSFFLKSGDLVYSLDLDGTILEMSDTWQNISGFAVKEVVGQSIYSFLHPDDHHKLHELVRLGGDTQRLTHNDVRLRHADGSYSWYVVASVFSEMGGEQRLCGVAKCINPQKNKTEGLNWSLTLAVAALESSGRGILVVGHSGEVVMRTAEFMRIWDIEKDNPENENLHEQLLCCLLSKVINPERHQKRVAHYYRHPELCGNELFHLINGRVIDGHTSPLIDKGEIIGRVWSFQDITDQLQLELKLRDENEVSMLRQQFALLTYRERKILSMIGEGLKTSEMAEKLGLSRRTVDDYRSHIKTKLDADGASDIFRLAHLYLKHFGNNVPTANSRYCPDRKPAYS